MRSSGNGRPEICVYNLLQLTRGEVPMERIKGIDPRLIDKPSTTVEADLVADIKFGIETFEPRVQPDGAELRAMVPNIGQYETAAAVDVEGAIT